MTEASLKELAASELGIPLPAEWLPSDLVALLATREFEEMASRSALARTQPPSPEQILQSLGSGRVAAVPQPRTTLADAVLAAVSGLRGGQVQLYVNGRLQPGGGPIPLAPDTRVALVRSALVGHHNIRR